MRDSQEHIDRLKRQLEGWGRQIDELEAAARKSAGGLHAEGRAAIAELKRKREEAWKKIEALELDVAAGDSGETLQDGVDRLWAHLTDVLERARAVVLGPESKASR